MATSVTATGWVRSRNSRGVAEDGADVAQVRFDVVRGARLMAGQEGAGVSEHDRVVIRVQDAGLGRDRLGDLVHVTFRRDAGADVEELPYPRLPGEVADGAAEERPVRAGGERPVRVDPGRLLGRLPVGGVIVLAAEQVVVDPGLVRHGDIERQCPGPDCAAVHRSHRSHRSHRRLVTGHLERLLGSLLRGSPSRQQA